MIFVPCSPVLDAPLPEFDSELPEFDSELPGFGTELPGFGRGRVVREVEHYEEVAAPVFQRLVYAVK